MRPYTILLLALVAFLPACSEEDGPTPGSKGKDKSGAHKTSGTQRHDGPSTKHGKKNAVKPNRLAKERSPYLRQHQYNPVDWYPWGEEAFAKAKAENKPIFLSVGYAACHWCHVMEHESFEDEATAKILDDVFVCVKVDREERPDVDGVYMSYVQMRTGRGGWPMTVFLTPDRLPFWGGTYLPREQLKQVCAQTKKIWAEHRDELVKTAEAYAERLREMADGQDLQPTDDSDATILKTMRTALRARFDHKHGGYGTRPKFPPHSELLFYLSADGARMEPEDRAQVLATLDAIERGGIHDQVGGGFARYSTDERWLLPHFEKMLYDNALLAQAYAGAYALTKAPKYRRAVERLFAWLEREMRQKAGGYASSLDADTEGEEGLTYTWTWDELKAVLAAEELSALAPIFGLERQGNFHDEATRAPSGRNIPHWTMTRSQAAKKLGINEAALVARVDEQFEIMRVARDKRPQPGLDDKVIVGWNGLLLSAFARAGVVLAEPSYLKRGADLAAYMLEHCRRPDGTLLRFPKESGPEIVGFCEDHCHFVEGLLDLADATGDTRWADAALALGQQMNALFLDTKGGGFFSVSESHHEALIARSKETWDSPIPSDNGAAARANIRLYQRTGDKAFLAAADSALTTFRATMAHPRMAPGVMALIRALADRMALGEVTGALLAGDVRARRGVAVVDAWLEYGTAKPGSRVGLLVRLTLEKGWHVNANKPSRKELIGTALGLAPHAVAGLEDVRYPAPVTRTLGGSEIALLEGSVDVRAVLTIPADATPGPRNIPLTVRFQPCDASSCHAPVELVLELPLRFGAETGPRQHPSLFK